MSITLVCQECGEEYSRPPSAAKNSKFCSNRCSGKGRSHNLTKDLTGQRFGRWIVLEKSNETTKYYDLKWRCRCECGTERIIFGNSLKCGKSKSCGCLKLEINQKQAAQLFTKPIAVGSKFERLTVLHSIDERKNGCVVYCCSCECGNETFVRGVDLKSGNTKSCGCYNIDCIKERSTTHGRTGKLGFSQWRHQVRREADSDWTLNMSILLFEMFPRCVICSSDDKLATDHVIPIASGGRLTPGNATVLCKSCNSRKRSKDLDDLPDSWASRILETSKRFEIAWNSRL